MIKKLAVVAAVVSVIAVGHPAQAVPLYCYTNYIQNGAFDYDHSWTYDYLAYRETTADDPCDSFGYAISAAALKNPGDAVSQSFTTGGNTAMSWSMSLDVQAHSIAGATVWDEFKVIAENLTTGQSELIGLIKGTQLTGTCQRFNFSVAQDYSNAQVRITVNAQAFTSLDVYIDNVAFFGRYC